VVITKNVNKNNADHSILFEAIKLVLVLGNRLPDSMRRDTIELLAKFVSQANNPNIKYLALESLSRLTSVCLGAAQDANVISKHL
jgi:AP-2 complex subunit alpha